MSQSTIPDVQLVQKAAKGDRKAFATLFDQYFQSVYNFALSLCRDPAMAEDLTQEAFIRAHANLDRFGPPWNFRTWVFRLTRNYFIDLTRKEREIEPLEEGHQVKSADPSPEKETMLREVADRVQSTLDRLRVHHREILVLRELNGFSYAEIGEIMDISGSNVKVMLHRARADFQETYGIRLLLEEPTEDCEEVAKLLHVLHDKEELFDQERLAKEHLKDCEACQQRKRWLVTQSGIFAALIPVIPPAALGERIMQETGGKSGWRSAQRSGQVRRVLGYGAAAGAVGAAAWLLILLFGNIGVIFPNLPQEGNGEQPAAAPTEVQPSPTPTIANPPPPPPLPPIEATPTVTQTLNEPLDPIGTVLRETLCWGGPGGEYDVISSLVPNTEVELLGTGEGGGYLVISNPRYNLPCWVKEADVDTGGFDAFSLPIVRIPAVLTEPPTQAADGSVSGQVWKDNNADGTMQPNENGYPGVHVFLGAGSCGDRAMGHQTATTNINGYYQFADVSPGTYCLYMALAPTCESHSIATTDLEHTIVMTSGGSFQYLFGFAPYIC